MIVFIISMILIIFGFACLNFYKFYYINLKNFYRIVKIINFIDLYFISQNKKKKILFNNLRLLTFYVG